MDTLVDDNLIWPSNESLAEKMSMAFMVRVLDSYAIEFEKNFNPLVLSKKYLKGVITDAEIYEACQYWADNISEDEWRNPFRDETSLKKRLALCILFSESNKGKNMTYTLHFFAEVLDALGYDLESHLTSLTDALLEPRGKLYLVKLINTDDVL